MEGGLAEGAAMSTALGFFFLLEEEDEEEAVLLLLEAIAEAAG